MSVVDLSQPKLTNSAHDAVGGNPDPNKILAANINMLARYQSIVISMVLMTAGASVYALWDFTDHALLIGWALAVLPVYGIRLLILRYFHRDPRQTENIRGWALAFTFSIGLGGAWFGSIALLFFDPAQPMSMAFVTAIIFAFGTKGGMLSHHPPASYLFYSFVTWPLAAQCLVSGVAPYQVIGGFMALCWAMNFFGIAQMHAGFVEMIRLRWQNEELVKQLRHDRDRADNANRAKSTFLAAVSHDLRQPAHAAGLFLSTIMRMTDRATLLSAHKVRDMADKLHSALNSLSTLLDALLDISRLDARVIKPSIEPIVLQDVFDRLQARFSEQAKARGLELRICPTTAIVSSDPMLLERILGNLLSNALRYTDQGKVLLGCRRRAHGVHIQVIDTGPGIVVEHHESIFEEFTQLDNPARNRQRGLGLGLAIVKRCANLLDHVVRLSSRTGAGSCFTIGIAYALHQPVDIQMPLAESVPQGKGVLIVDDEAMVRSAMSAILETEGFAVVVCEGLHDIEAAIGQTKIDIIIADYRLANGDLGTAAIERAFGILRRRVPAIIITGDTSPERIEQAAAAGHRLLHKPVTAERLITTLIELLRRQAA